MRLVASELTKRKKKKKKNLSAALDEPQKRFTRPECC
jgi:hypothetical protein